MISFIIIGRNEGWKLSKCINSVINTIDYNKLDIYEIIYVDSNSSDDSLKRAKKNKKVKIFELIGDVNAAIARNVGAFMSKGDILFFLDGDMEINKDAFRHLFDVNMKLKYNFVSGDFCNIYYNNRNSKDILSKELYHKNTIVKKEFTTGGLFVIKKKLWKMVGGMRPVFKRSQDMDLGLRLSKKGFFLYRLPILLAYHHTISYVSKNRKWQDLVNDTHLYGRSLLYRKNIFNINTLKLFIKQDISLLSFIVLIIFSVLFKKPELLIGYFIIVLIRSVKNKMISNFFYYIIRDLRVLFGLFFFHPVMKGYSYNTIKK